MTTEATDTSCVGRLMQLPGRRPCAAMGLLAVIFVSGALVGGGLMAIFRPERPSGRRSMEEIRDRLTDEIAEGIGGLSETQTEQIRI